MLTARGASERESTAKEEEAPKDESAQGRRPSSQWREYCGSSACSLPFARLGRWCVARREKGELCVAEAAQARDLQTNKAGWNSDFRLTKELKVGL